MPERKTNDKRIINIQFNLLDVMYGVVLSYGFNFFGAASSVASKIFFFLSYLIVIADWIFIHELYSENEYRSKVLFFSDIVVLFFVSRVIAASVVSPEAFFMWMAILFMSYFLWDFVACRVITLDRWASFKLSDFLTSIFFFVMWILVRNGVVKGYFIIIVGVIACLVVLFYWLYSEKFRKNKALR